MFLSNEEVNAYNSHEFHLVLKCVINVLTLIEKQQQLARLQHGSTNLHVPELLLRKILQTDNEEVASQGDTQHLQPDYCEYLVNMMKIFQIYLITYQSLNYIKFEQCYVNKRPI